MAPSALLKKPAGHGSHDREPSALAKKPAPHVAHAEARAPLTPEEAVPTGQERHAAAPATEYCPARQLTQATAPACAATVPAVHAWHCVAPAFGAAEPSKQGTQEAAATAPSAALARPTGQAMQPSSVCPGAGL